MCRIIESYCDAAAVEMLVPISQRFHVRQTYQAPQPFALQKPMCNMTMFTQHEASAIMVPYRSQHLNFGELSLDSKLSVKQDKN